VSADLLKTGPSASKVDEEMADAQQQSEDNAQSAPDIIDPVDIRTCEVTGADEICEVTGADEICEVTGADEICEVTGADEICEVTRTKIPELLEVDMCNSNEMDKMDEIITDIETLRVYDDHKWRLYVDSLSPTARRLAGITENVSAPAVDPQSDALVKNWFNNDAERDVFTIFLCVALNIDKPTEFTNEMHPKTVIDKAVWIRPKCPIERPQNDAAEYVVSRMPALYGVSATDIEKHRASSRNFRDFLRTMIDLDKANHSSDPEMILHCKGSGCINDKFQKNNDSGVNLSCADCVHVELEKMIGGPRGALKGMFEGNACYRNLKDVLESEIRGNNLSVSDIQRNALCTEKTDPKIYCGPRSGIVDLSENTASCVKPRFSRMRESVPESEKKIESVPAPILSLSHDETPQMNSALRDLAVTFSQLLPAQAKKVTIAITYES
jgi:hypothetical protein